MWIDFAQASRENNVKKIKTLFVRDAANPSIVTREYGVTPDPSWEPTRKRDGTAIRVLGGKVYRRFDAKHGKTPPAGFVPCQDAPESDGHFPGWVPIDCPAGDKTTARVCAELHAEALADGTYELCGPKFQGNPERIAEHVLFRHGGEFLNAPTDFDGLKAWFAEHPIEGIVFWANGAPVAKIKRRDFGLPWPA